MRTREVIKPTEFTAEILDGDLTVRDLKEEAYEKVIEHCHREGYWLLKKPKVRISHVRQVAVISAYIVRKGDPVWA